MADVASGVGGPVRAGPSAVGPRHRADRPRRARDWAADRHLRGLTATTLATRYIVM